MKPIGVVLNGSDQQTAWFEDNDLLDIGCSSTNDETTQQGASRTELQAHEAVQKVVFKVLCLFLHFLKTGETHHG
ncbi:hypothetical protein [Photobacterium halotolerans]|uniref:hypothetical protein n=1 Tax=Photobacterium halotolerans TaxID=265726 RepID=UPI00047F4513|nr:hypothetical protein [Photobacterium halotolerans]